MRNKILLFILVVLIAVYSYIRSFENKTSFFNENENIISYKDTTTNDIISMEVEDYLIGVLAGEMPASFNIEALKAQAVASRTFAYYKINTSSGNYDLTNDTTSQVHITDEEMKRKWQDNYEFYKNKIIEAINSTKNEVLTFNDKVISSYYFAMSNGYTENASFVFSESKDYLKSVESQEDTNNKNFEVTKKISKSEFCNLLNIECNTIMITNVTRTDSNRINTLSINNKLFTGIELRKKLSLRSTDFSIKEKDNDIYITTKGYGHGVGMSQYGANNMANKGYNYKEILSHYYQNTELKNINSINV